MPAMPRDTKLVKHPGVYARHRRGCALEDGAERCSCRPAYWAKVWDRATAKTLRTQMCSSASAARNARHDLIEGMRRGVAPVSDGMRVARAIDAFVRAARDGVALNKHGRRYKPSAIRDLDGCLNGHVEPVLGRRRLGDVRRGDVQRLIDGMAGKSGSRVRSVVNAIRSLYAWAQDRELVQHDPASRVRLPAMDARPRDRVATPVELRDLLVALAGPRPPRRRRGGVAEPSPLADALPFAIAAYATARRAEIRHLLVEDVDLDLGVVYLGVDENGRKSRAAQRAVPIVKPLGILLRRALLERGRPDGGEYLCPGLKPGGVNSGMLSFEALQDRADKVWERARLQRITAHECRHTAASWMDAAGVRPKVASILMGHSVARAGDGAAITRDRYTHALPGDLERARDQLAAYIAAQVEAEGARGAGTG